MPDDGQNMIESFAYIVQYSNIVLSEGHYKLIVSELWHNEMSSVKMLIFFTCILFCDCKGGRAVITISALH